MKIKFLHDFPITLQINCGKLNYGDDFWMLLIFDRELQWKKKRSEIENGKTKIKEHKTNYECLNGKSNENVHWKGNIFSNFG